MNNSEQANAAGGAPALVTPDEAAELMRVCKRTVTRLCDDGELKAVKVRNQWRINREALRAYCGLAGEPWARRDTALRWRRARSRRCARNRYRAPSHTAS